MLEAISADEVGRNGDALEVIYQPDPLQPELLLVDVTAHETRGDSTHVRTSELSVIVAKARMTAEAMRARVAVEAAKRGIDRVAWIAAASD